MAAQMKLKLQMRKPLQKHGRTVAMEEVAMEERRTQMHDVFGSKDCFLDPHSSHVTYCLKSVYNLYHPSHVCQMGVPCDCQVTLADVEYL